MNYHIKLSVIFLLHNHRLHFMKTLKDMYQL